MQQEKVRSMNHLRKGKVLLLLHCIYCLIKVIYTNAASSPDFNLASVLHVYTSYVSDCISNFVPGIKLLASFI